MLKKLKYFLFAALSAASIFVSCKSQNLYDYIDTEEEKSAEMSISGLSSSSDSNYDYLLDATNSILGLADGSFTVTVANEKPSKIQVKSASSKISFSASEITENSDGTYSSVVTYSVADDLELAEDESVLETKFSVYALFSSSDTIQKNVLVKASYISENSAYELKNFAVSGQNEHVFTLSWENPQGASYVLVSYKIYLLTTTDDGEGNSVTEKTLVESGSLSTDASSLTNTSSLAAKSNYYVEITVSATDGWYTTGTDSVEIATTDDITPPTAPSLSVTGTAEESVTLKYTKGDSSDDTAALFFEITCADESVTVPELSTLIDSYTDDDGLDVSSVTSGAEQEIVINGLKRSSQAIDYTIKVHAKDALKNDSASLADNAGIVELTASTVADTTAPELSSASVSVGLNSAKIEWENPTDSDFAGIKIMKGSDVVASSVTDEYYVLTDLTEGGTYTLYSFDTVGNVQATGVEVAVSLKTLTASAEAQYTGSILVSWNNLTDYTSDGTAVDYTYSVSATSSDGGTLPDDKTSLSSTTSSAAFTGLTVGSSYTFTVKALADSTEKASATTDGTEAVTVILKIGNGYDASGTSPTRYLAWGASSSSTTCYNTGALPDSDNPTASYWIIRPALSGTEGYFSLEAATGTTGLGTGYYLYIDKTRDYVAYNKTWGSGGWTNGFAMVATTTGVENDGTSYITDNKQASFYWGTSSWNSSYSRMYSEGNEGYYVCHASLTFGITNSSSEDSAGCAAFLISNTYTSEKDYSADVPSAVTSLTATASSASEINLSWTNPSDEDFSYVEITYGTESVTSTGNSAVISGLVANTTYEFSVVVYDVYGNASTATTASATTPEGTNYPTNATVATGYTGQIIVTWTDATSSSDFTYTVSVTSSESTETIEAKTVAQGVGKAIFNNLTVGNTYTFTLKATLNSTDYAYTGTLSATAVNKKVHILNGGGKYLQVKTGNDIAFFESGTSNTYTWLVMPSLADEYDTNTFTLKSVDEDTYLVVDTETDFSTETNPSGGWVTQNSSYVLILTDKPTDSDGYKKASFQITEAASGEAGYSSFLLVYDTSKYLRDWWNIASCGDAQTGSNAIYSSLEFVDVTE